MTCTKLRHMAVTVMSCLLGKEELVDLAELMGHSVAMQQGVYNDALKDSKVARMSGMLGKVLRGESLCRDDVDEAFLGK